MRASRLYLSAGSAVVVFAVGWFILSKGRVASQNFVPAFATTTVSVSLEQATSSSAEISKPSRTVPAGEKEYDNAQYHFSLFYPSGLAVTSDDEGAGASTIIFQNAQTAQGFQIYIVPYSAEQVSEAQFERDEPSGVRQQSQNVTIDGAVGTSFYSTNIALGATAEIWFVHGDYLYEVTTFKPLASWLSNLMQSWKFI